MLIYDSFSFIGRKHYTIGKISFVSLTYIYIYMCRHSRKCTHYKMIISFISFCYFNHKQ